MHGRLPTLIDQRREAEKRASPSPPTLSRHPSPASPLSSGRWFLAEHETPPTYGCQADQERVMGSALETYRSAKSMHEWRVEAKVAEMAMDWEVWLTSLDAGVPLSPGCSAIT